MPDQKAGIPSAAVKTSRMAWSVAPPRREAAITAKGAARTIDTRIELPISSSVVGSRSTVTSQTPV